MDYLSSYGEYPFLQYQSVFLVKNCLDGLDQHVNLNEFKLKENHRVTEQGHWWYEPPSRTADPRPLRYPHLAFSTLSVGQECAFYWLESQAGSSITDLILLPSFREKHVMQHFLMMLPLAFIEILICYPKYSHWVSRTEDCMATTPVKEKQNKRRPEKWRAQHGYPWGTVPEAIFRPWLFLFYNPANFL